MTVDLLEALTSTRTWTVDDIADFPEDGRFEIVDGRLQQMAPGLWFHETAGMELGFTLNPVLPPGLKIVGAVAVGLDRLNVRVPDLVVARRDYFLTHRDVYAGAPEAVVIAFEVMSPSSKVTDRVTKPAQYAEAGIPFYWRLEPEEALLIAYALRDGAYVEVARASGDDPLILTEPFPVTIVPNVLLPH